MQEVSDWRDDFWDEALKDKIVFKAAQKYFKFTSNFPWTGVDDVTIILKAHLLIEELLIDFVSKQIKKPEKLENFKFYHYLCLAKALDDVRGDYWMWLAGEKIFQTGFAKRLGEFKIAITGLYVSLVMKVHPLPLRPKKTLDKIYYDVK